VILRRLAAVLAVALACACPGWAAAEVLWEGRVQTRDGRWLTVSKQLIGGRPVTMYADEAGRPVLESDLRDDGPLGGPARVSPGLAALAGGPRASRSVPVLVTLRDQPTPGIAADVKAIFDPQVDRQAATLRTARESHRVAAPAEEQARAQDVHQARDALKQTMAARRLEIGRRAQAVMPALQAGVRQHLASLGGVITHAYAIRNMLAARLPAAMIPVLALHPAVAEISEDAEMTTLLDTSTISLGAPTWWSHGFDGAGPWDVGVLDTGMDLTNPGFSGVPSQSGVFLATASSQPGFGDNAASPDDQHSHGTHTGGIVVSQGAPGFVNHKGVAIGAGIINLKAGFRTTSGGGSMYNSDAMAAVEWAAFTATSPADVFSLSFGGCTSASDSAYARFWDSVVDELDIPVAIAGGNSGPNNQTVQISGCPPPPTFYDPALAYNIITVGAMSDLATTDRSDDVVASYSTRGPVPDGRRKPDLTAPGSSIVSTSNTWETGADYVAKSGTSMAAPHIAGALALLLDGGIADAKALKAVLINSAQDLGTTGWSADSGWGYADLTAAFALRTSYFLGSVSPRGQPGSVRFYRGSLGAGERATLVWNRNADYRGTQSAIAFGLNDLDLTLYRMSDGGVLGSSASAIDNVEQVRVSGATAGLVLKVAAISTAFNGVSAEAYALATGTGISEASGPALAVSLAAPGSAGAGSQFSATATVTNTGDLTAHGNCVTLALPAGFSVVTGTNPQCVGSVGAGAQAVASWTVQAAVAAGPYGLSATDASSSYGESFSATGSATVTVTAQPALPVVTIVASDPTATEAGLTTGAFTVSRTGPTTSPLTVSWSITGTAVKNVDRVPVPVAPTIPAGASSVVILVTPIDDTLVEGPETVIATLTAGTGYTVGSPSTATVTIEDNDVALPVVTIAASDATATEAGPTTGAFTISRTGATTSALTVFFSVGGTADGADRQALPASVTIPVGASSVPLVVTPVDDSVAESSESVVVTLTANAAYQIGSPTSATVTIADNDTALPVVTIVASDPIATEAGLTTGSFTVSRTGPTTSALTVAWTITGTAVKNVDRLSVPLSPTIPAGASSVVITVTPLQDTLVEGNETITATLGAGSGYIVGSPSTATVTIVDDD
jgi:hypothetical protein